MKDALNACLNSLNNIQHYLGMMISDTSYDLHMSTFNHLIKLTDLCDEALNSDEVQKLEGKQPDLFPERTGTIIISCDASVKNNPGGPCSSGVVIRFPSAGIDPHELCRILPTAVTNNQAEYDAVYEGLNYFLTFGILGAQGIEVRSDSKLVVNQLNDAWAVKDEKLKHRHESVQELVQKLNEQLKIPISIVWYPRNSTEDLKKANNIAQSILGVKNH